MSSLFNFESLLVYQKAITLTQKVYTITQLWPKEHIFGLTSQLQRACSSIPLNIAEGSSRTQKDFRHFLIISRGSCFECIAILTIAQKLNLIEITTYSELYNQINEIAKMLSSLRSSLK